MGKLKDYFLEKQEKERNLKMEEQDNGWFGIGDLILERRTARVLEIVHIEDDYYIAKDSFGCKEYVSYSDATLLLKA